jgi:DNA-binding transcriptional ArsR family regulator
MELDRNTHEEYIEFLKNLGQDTRLRIVESLLNGEKSVSELKEIIKDVSPANLSNHLTKLRHLRYVYTHRKGKFVYYGIKDPRIPCLIRVLGIHLLRGTQSQASDAGKTARGL